MKINYRHPLEYAGLKINTPNNQLIMKAYVEANCLKCDKFMGREHDFSECNIKPNSKECTCPLECRKGVSLIQPESDIHLDSE